MNLFDLISKSYATYLEVNFCETLGVDVPNLPNFGAYFTRTGELAVFMGRVSDTDYGRVWKALEVFAKDTGCGVLLREAA